MYSFVLGIVVGRFSKEFWLSGEPVILLSFGLYLLE